MGYMVKERDMVTSPKSGHTYTIVKEINQGGFAFAYKAVDESGKVVFFKQYKSPSKLVPWFSEYFEYEAELNRRLRDDPVLKSASIFANEVFLGIPCGPDGVPWSKHENIFQVFPFIEGNINLDDMISTKAELFDWTKRVYACTVFAFALRKLHDADIIHCDLKPENVQVREDPTIEIRYRPLLIDMDWSILSDKRAPWDGSQGYVGTVGYMSPEHIRGKAPLEASDVFTAAIIISQVLADAHPFASHFDADDFNDYVLSGKNDFSGSGIPFKGKVTPKLGDLLMKALSPTASSRPTMEAIHLELMEVCKLLTTGGTGTGTGGKGTGTGGTGTGTGGTGTGTGGTGTGTGGTGTGEEKHLTQLVLKGDVGSWSTRESSFRLDQGTLMRVSSQANFADTNEQFSVQLVGGTWSVVGNPKVANPTTLNGVEVGASPMPLKDGDRIALKGRSSGKTAMELTVQLVAD